MAFYNNGNPVSGLNSIPRLTLAQYNALNVKPEFWVRTDAPESYKKLSADQVSYDSNNTVEDKIEELEQFWNASGSNCTDTTLTISLVKIGRIVFGNINDGNASASAGGVIAKFPSGFVPNSNSRYDFRDSYSQKRLQVKSEGIIAMESVNNILRGTFMYYV